MTDKKKKKGFWRSIGRRDPSSRHSLIETSSQCSFDNSSDDLRTSQKSAFEPTTGSLDRLTALSSKPPKPSFFHLKPKTPAFWKPLFQHTTLMSTAPVVHTGITLVKHKLVQTDSPTKASTSDCAVQVVIGECSAHTRNVLVQTCPAWDESSRQVGQIDPIVANSYSSAVHVSKREESAAVGKQQFPIFEKIEEKATKVNFVSGCGENSLHNVETSPLNYSSGEEIPILENLSHLNVLESKMNNSSISRATYEFEDPDWKLLCETFPEIQSSLVDSVTRKSTFGTNNVSSRNLTNFATGDGGSTTQDLREANPLSKLKFQFSQLKNDFDVLPNLTFHVSTKPSNQIQDMVIDPHFDVLREENAVSETVMSDKSSSGDLSNGQCLTNVSCLSQSCPQYSKNNSPTIYTNSDIGENGKPTSCTSTTKTSVMLNVESLLHDESSLFDSLENLDELEEEIIRSLCSPVQELDQYPKPHSNINEPENDTDRHNFDELSSPDDSKAELEKNPLIMKQELNSADSSKLQNKSNYEFEVNKNWKMLAVPLENITEESATDEDSGFQIDRKTKSYTEDKNVEISKICADVNKFEKHPYQDKFEFQCEVPSVSRCSHFTSVNEVFEETVELPPRRAKICIDVLEVARVTRSPSHPVTANEPRSACSALGETTADKIIEPTHDMVDSPSENPSAAQNINSRCCPTDSGTLDDKNLTDFYEPKQRDTSPEVKHVSQSFIILEKNRKDVEFSSSSDPLTCPDSNTLPPPPPPPMPTSKSCIRTHMAPTQTMNSEHAHSYQANPVLKSCTVSSASPCKSSMIFELEQRFLTRQKMADDLENITKKIAMDVQKECGGLMTDKDVSLSQQDCMAQHQNRMSNGNCKTRQSPPQTGAWRDNTSSSHPRIINTNSKEKFAETTVVTNQPPPPGAVLISEEVTVDGDQVHCDKYYAIPIKEILKEKKSATKFIPAPPKYEGIGPTEEGIPLSLRQSVKKENMSDWYKSMYKTLHKIESEGDTYVIDYTSDPEIKREEKQTLKKLDVRTDKVKHENVSNGNVVLQRNFPSTKPTDTFSPQPRSISEYEPGHSSIVDNQPNLGSKRYSPTVSHTKSLYEINDEDECVNYVLKRNLISEPDEEKQKIWYKQIQKGGDVPQFGLGKSAPEKRQDPVVGPPPLQSSNNCTPLQEIKASRPTTLPPDYLDVSDSGVSHQCLGSYATQMRQAIHSELQQKGYQVLPTTKNVKNTAPEKRLIARVLYNFSAESPREMSLMKDDIVLIHKELDKNWYEGEFNAVVGIFPISYVEVLPPEHTLLRQKVDQAGLAKVLYDFMAHTPAELQAKKGDEIHLLRKVDNNWYEGKIGNNKGIIPSSYICIIEDFALPLEKQENVSHTPMSISSPRSNDICHASPISPLSSTSLNSSVTSGVIGSPQYGIKPHNKKGSHLIQPVLYRALYRYTPQNADELEIVEGDSVYVVEMCDDGWYVGTSVRTGELGLIPGNYLENVE